MLPATNPVSVQPISHMQLQWNTLKPDFYLNSIWNATQTHFYRLLSEYIFSADIISFHSIDILLKTQFNEIFFCVLEQDCCFCFALDLSKRVFHVFFFSFSFGNSNIGIWKSNCLHHFANDPTNTSHCCCCHTTKMCARFK